MAGIGRRVLQLAAAVGLSAAAGPAQAQDSPSAVDLLGKYSTAYHEALCTGAVGYMADATKTIAETRGKSGTAGAVILSAHATTPPAQQALNWSPGLGACGEKADKAQRMVFERTLKSNNALLGEFLDKFEEGQIPARLMPRYELEYQKVLARLRAFKESGLVEIKDSSSIQNDTPHQWNILVNWNQFGDITQMDDKEWHERLLFIKSRLSLLEELHGAAFGAEKDDIEAAMFMLQMFMMDIGEPPSTRSVQSISVPGKQIVMGKAEGGRFTTDTSGVEIDRIPLGFGDLDTDKYPQLRHLRNYEQMFDRLFTFHFQAVIESHFGTQADVAAIKNDKKRRDAVAELDRDFGMDKVVKEALTRTLADLRFVNVNQEDLDKIVQKYEMRARMGADRMPEILDLLMAKQRVSFTGYTGEWAGKPNPTGGRYWIETPPLRLSDDQGFWERQAWTEMDRMVNDTLRSTPLSPANDGSGLAVFKPCVTGGKVTFTVSGEVIESPEDPCASFAWPKRDSWGNDGIPDSPRGSEELDSRYALLQDAAQLEATRPKR